MVIFLRNPRALCAKATRTVGESRLEGEDSRSRTARASARHRSVQDERVAIRSSNGGVSRQGTQSKGCARGSHRRHSLESSLTPAGMGPYVSGELRLLNGAKGRAEGEIPR
jgi:hypothetical protein